MELTLTKTKTFKLEPFGKFFITMARHPKSAPHIIPHTELDIDWESAMPFSIEQEKEIIKLMKKHKTDIFADGSYFGFYTRVSGDENASLALVRHPKFRQYHEDEGFKALVDSAYK